MCNKEFSHGKITHHKGPEAKTEQNQYAINLQSLPAKFQPHTHGPTFLNECVCPRFK